LDEGAAPQLPEWSNGQLLKAFFVPRTEGSNLAPPAERHVANVSDSAIRSWSGILHGRRLKPAPAVLGEDWSRVSPPIRPCAVPRPSGRGLLAETTARACGHTCRMRPERERRLYQALPLLPQSAGREKPPLSGAPFASAVRPSCPSAAAGQR